MGPGLSRAAKTGMTARGVDVEAAAIHRPRTRRICALAFPSAQKDPAHAPAVDRSRRPDA